MDQLLQPLACVTLLQQRRQDHLQQQQLQRQLAHRGVAAETTHETLQARPGGPAGGGASPVQRDVVRKKGREEQLDDSDGKPQHQQNDGAKDHLEVRRETRLQ